MSGLNTSNPAIRRLMREAMELSNSTVEYHAAPLDENLFEWHFTIRGPPNTCYASGIYHGTIIFPSEYPMKPPTIILLTPNGRFEVGKKICLSVSSFHPEEWQPCWGVRTILLAMIGFLPTPAEGAVGGMDLSDKERLRLALQSGRWVCPSCNKCNADILLSDVSACRGTEISGEVSDIVKKLRIVSPEEEQPGDALSDAPPASDSTKKGDVPTEEGNQTRGEDPPESVGAAKVPEARPDCSDAGNASDARTAEGPLWSYITVPFRHVPVIRSRRTPDELLVYSGERQYRRLVLPFYDWVAELRANQDNAEQHAPGHGQKPNLDASPPDNAQHRQGQQSEPESPAEGEGRTAPPVNEQPFHFHTILLVLLGGLSIILLWRKFNLIIDKLPYLG